MHSLSAQNTVLQKTLWVKKGETLEEREVKTGTSSGSLIEITEGISEGEEVVLGMELAKGRKQSVDAQEERGGGSPFMPTPPGKKKKN